MPTAANTKWCCPGIRFGERHGGTRHSAILQPNHGRHYQTSKFVYAGTSIAQEHVEPKAAVEVLQLHHVGGMKSSGSTVQKRLSPGTTTAVDLTWLLVCVRCEAAVCYSVVSRASRTVVLGRRTS